MSIPKIIHFCWFGGAPLPPAVEKCIASWRKFCPDYEIRRWTEQNFDVAANRYASQALAAGKYAFVSDYARLKVLYDHGGIYLDTDVELIRPLDGLLAYRGYIGFERGGFAPGGGRIFEAASGLGLGAEAGHPVIRALLDDYAEIPFLDGDGRPDTMTCPQRNTRCLTALGLRADNTHQVIDGFHILPDDYLCPMDYLTRKTRITPNTYSIHHYDGRYLTLRNRARMLWTRFYLSPFYDLLRRIKHKLMP